MGLASAMPPCPWAEGQGHRDTQPQQTSRMRVLGFTEQMIPK